MTRFYFPETEAAAVSPTISGTDWGHINTVRRRLLHTNPDSSTLTTTAYTPDGSDHAVDMNAHHRQYVSDPLDAQNISGTVKAALQGLEAHVNNNLYLTMKIYIVDQAGTTEKETLLSISRDAGEFTTSILNRFFDSVAIATVNTEANDRIVVEIGLGGSPGGGSGTQGHNGSLRFGGNASSGDLPENDTEAGATFRPWIEFSDTIYLYGTSPSFVAAWGQRATRGVIGTGVY